MLSVLVEDVNFSPTLSVLKGTGIVLLCNSLLTLFLLYIKYELLTESPQSVIFDETHIPWDTFNGDYKLRSICQ